MSGFGFFGLGGGGNGTGGSGGMGMADSAGCRMNAQMAAFIAESNRIEGITRPVTQHEYDAHRLFWAERRLTVAGVETFVQAICGAPLRREFWQNVQVGHHLPPRGGPHIERELRVLLRIIEQQDLTPYQAHVQYETLHPFMDGNGRSGRAIWAWHMAEIGQDPFALSFLHTWYYQSLDAER